MDGKHVLLGEVKWRTGRESQAVVRGAIGDLFRKGLPLLHEIKEDGVVRVVFVSDAKPGIQQGVHVVNAEQVLQTCRDTV
jgi:hypothetical protein